MKILKFSLAVLMTLFIQATVSAAQGVQTNAPVRACCAAALAAREPALSDKSIYQVDSTWITDQQKQIKLGDLAGRPQVVLMFYAHCTTACPMLINDLRRIESALPAELRAKTGFLLVSFDTDRDTPAALADYRQNWNLPKENWTLLSGKPDDVLELAVLLGIQYKKEAAGQFAHSNVITVLDAHGEIVHQQSGLNGDIDETVKIIEQLNHP